MSCFLIIISSLNDFLVFSLFVEDSLVLFIALVAGHKVATQLVECWRLRHLFVQPYSFSFVFLAFARLIFCFCLAMKDLVIVAENLGSLLNKGLCLP